MESKVEDYDTLVETRHAIYHQLRMMLNKLKVIEEDMGIVGKRVFKEHVWNKYKKGKRCQKKIG